MTTRVFLTGATGFVGSHVARRLVQAGCQVSALVRPTADTTPIADLKDSLTLVEGDLRDGDALERSLVASDPTVCVHLAWYAAPKQYLHGLENLEAVAASATLLRALARTGCRRIVFVGSCAEYEPSAGCVDERSPVRPTTLYAACKQAVWLMVDQFARARGGTAVAARLFHVYGPREPVARLVPSVITALLAGRPCPLTRGDQMRDLLHVEDVAGAIWAVARSEIAGAVNIAAGMPVSIAEVAQEIGRQVGRPDLLELGRLPQGADDRRWLCATRGRLQTELEWKPRFTLPGGLAHTIEWWRTHIRHAGRVSPLST
jgi:nucleoside-diphosphate-sugar epimerase